jgi:hypothetical protein
MSGQEHPQQRAEGLRGTVERSLAGEPLTPQAVLQSLGGWRGILESFLPGVVFIGTFAFTQDLLISAAAPTLAGIVALVVRAIQRIKLMPALIGLFGIVICSATTLFTGNPDDYFLPGLITNIAWLFALVISLLIRWPLLGFALGLVSGSLSKWRYNQRMRGAAYLATYVWLTMFVLRLSVQVPLYIADQVTWLGIARVTMGVPLFALVIMFTWMIIRAFVPKDDEEVPST